MRRVLLPILLLTALAAAGIFAGSYSLFRAQELDKAAARLTLYRSTVESELRRFAHLPFLLTLDSMVIETLNGGDRTKLNKRLARISQSAGIDAIYLMNSEGLTIAASNAALPSSFVGQNYGFRPYFKAALAGELGEFYGIGVTTGIPGYFYAMAVNPRAATNRGVVAIKLDLSALQNSWQAAGERIILSNSDGVVLLASDPDWRYFTLGPIEEAQRAEMVAAKQFGSEPLNALDWSANTENQTAEIDGEEYLYLRSRDLPNSWSLHFFTTDDQAVTRAWLATGTMVLLVGLILIGWQVRRVRQIGQALSRSEHEEAQLRLVNERLAVEIEERRAAERDLQKTQAELERSGRLAALGQLASSVTHELGQPIAAMRNQLAAAEISSGQTPLGQKMQGLVSRMEDITRQLKFFSRKGRDQFEPVHLAQIISDSLDLLAPNIEAAEAIVNFTPNGTSHVQLNGNRLRLEQVVTNLVRNALDAVEDADERQIDIALGENTDEVWFSITDTGHGLGGQTLDDLREPFATTRESGKGMGLGLTISAGIVSDHNGSLSAADAPRGGAVFRASFPTTDHKGTQ